MTTSNQFNESQINRAGDGKFATMSRGECDADVSLDISEVPTEWDAELLDSDTPGGKVARAQAHAQGETGYYEPSDAEVEDATRGYVYSLVGSSTVTPEPEEGEEEGEPTEADQFEMSDEATEACAADVRDFISSNKALIEEAGDVQPGYDMDQAMHDFALTRNGHGAGFWDRGLGDVGERLTAAAKSHGSHEIYLGDDGTLYT